MFSVSEDRGAGFVYHVTYSQKEEGESESLELRQLEMGVKVNWFQGESITEKRM